MLANPPLPEGYVGQEACGFCHAEIYQSFQEIGMGRSWASPSQAPLIEDYSARNTFFHEKSGFHYTMVQRDGRFYQRRHLLDAKGRAVQVHEEEVHYVVGSGNHARSYLTHHPNGVITQLPVTWYSQEKRWGMSPGYDVKDHVDFTRAIPQGCVFCHTAYPRSRVDQASDINYFPFAIPPGIGCERCHGPGAKHVRLARQGEPEEKLRSAIYNPGRDTKEAQREVCYQCHMEVSIGSVGTRVLRAGRDIYSFRPGEPFSDYAVQFSTKRLGEAGIEVVQHADLMEASACFRGSQGQMTCTSCHDPHRKVRVAEAASYYRERCVACHPASGLSKHTPSQRTGDCVSCHMPRAAPTNASHTVFTNHRVGIYPTRGSATTRSLTQETVPELEFRIPKSLQPPDNLFFLGAAYLDAPIEELAQKPDLARRGIECLLQYQAARRKETAGPVDLGRSEWLLGKGYQAVNDVQSAIQHYQSSLALEDRQLPALYNLAILAAGQGDFEGSEKYFSRLLERFPDHVPSRHGLGALAEGVGRHAEAIRHFEEVLKLFPGAVSSRYRLAQIYLRQQKLEKGEAELEACLALDPRYLPALVDLGNLRAAAQRFAEARWYFERALQLDASREEIYNAASVAADQSGDGSAALRFLEQAVSRGVAGETTYVNLGNLSARRGDFARALNYFEEARKRNPRNVRTLFGLAICHLKTSKVEQGRSLLEQILKLEPHHAEAKQVLDQLPKP
ncbi:MAG: tetratricopeptide repeat protein [Acidobacteriota bacterium]